MRGAALRYLRQECRCPRAREALGCGVIFHWLVMVCLALPVLGAASSQAASRWLDEVKLGVLAHLRIGWRYLFHFLVGQTGMLAVTFETPAITPVVYQEHKLILPRPAQ